MAGKWRYILLHYLLNNIFIDIVIYKLYTMITTFYHKEVDDE